ncbi:MAG: family 43 glycosylhydrolase [Clostridia bacterium]|nr:family 43 glycosylhydrolase [Clostridia bacterium]
MIIETGIKQLRDPFVVVEPDAYYVYGTEVSNGWEDSVWACYKSTSGLTGPWEITPKKVYVTPTGAKKHFWAPEVHKYKNFYYMFATYYSSVTNHRGCSILRAPSPEGPFVEISDGHITPKDWDAIDGTFWVDDDGQPWMIFVHEWTSTDDQIGRMAAAKLSYDLTHFISESKELFRADDAPWANKQVTDGCFMHKTQNGKLLMIWSNLNNEDYLVGIARSKNGKVNGEWGQDEQLLFSKEVTGKYDGGHGMIFTDRDGSMYLAVHSPNNLVDGLEEEVIFVPIRESKGTLTCY